MARILHVANGHCTTRLIEAAALPGRTQIWADVLHDGPVPDVPDEEFVRVRAAFIASSLEAITATVDEVEADLRGWRAAVDDREGYDELVLRYEHDLFDQLNLIQLLARIGRQRPAPNVSLVSIDAVPGHPHFKGLGELTPPDIASLFDRRTPVTPEQRALAADAWDAFRGTDRRRIDAFLARDTSALPYLAPALRRYLEEAPSGRDGLTRSERRLIEQLSRGPLDIHSAWSGMHEGERAYYITDTSFWTMVKGLAERSPALIHVSVDEAAAASLPRGTLSLAP
jgi:hypothetical protein